MRRLRPALLALGGLVLLAAMWGGLARVGWRLPALPAPVAALHGPLILSGFFGTVISLERAVALNRRWAYAAPALAGLGGLALAMGLPAWLGQVLLVAGGLALAAVFVVILRVRSDWSHLTLGLGALLWPAGSLLWLAGLPVSHVVPWWAGFLVLTIAGERLELARILRLRREALAAFLAATGLLLAGLMASLAAFVLGVRVAGVGLVALSIWLWRFDVARRTVRQSGLTRFIAVALLAGYAWLGVAGVLWVWRAEYFGAGPVYDAMLHSLLLGYVFSMIFAHAPLMAPTLLGTGVPYQPGFYATLGLLHASLILRILGDMLAVPGLRQWGGLLNVAALLLFAAGLALTLRRTPAPSV